MDVRRDSRIYNYVCAVMELNTNSRPFVFNLFTGTLPPLEIASLLATSPTSCELREIPLDPLDPEDGIEALRALYPECCHILDNKLFRRFFQLLGNIPRVWVAVGEIVRSYCSSFSSAFDQKEMKKLWKQVCERVTREFKIFAYLGDSESFSRALFVIMQKWNNTEKLESCGSEGLKQCIRGLLFDGFLFTDSIGCFFLPTLFLCEVARYRGCSSPEYNLFVDSVWKAVAGTFIPSVDFERVIIRLFSLKQHLFLKMGFDTPEVGEFFQGAYFGDHPTVGREKMELGMTPVLLANYHRNDPITSLDYVLLRRGIGEVGFDLTETGTAWAIHLSQAGMYEDGFLLMNDGRLLVSFQVNYLETGAHNEVALTLVLKYLLIDMNRNRLRPASLPNRPEEQSIMFSFRGKTTPNSAGA